MTDAGTYVLIDGTTIYEIEPRLTNVLYVKNGVVHK